MTKANESNRVLDRLGAHGQDYRDPVAQVAWADADDALPWLPHGLLSVRGLDNDQANRLSRFEFARLCAAGMWLEGLLISRVTEKGFLGLSTAEARVMLQEVREESGHSLMFLEMIERAGAAGVELLGTTGLLSWVARRLSPSSPEFWAMVYVGETVTDTFAIKALREARDGRADLCPVARQVLDLHHRDEARHISAARVFLSNRVGLMTPVRRAAFGHTLRFLLTRFLDATLYPTPATLAAAGIPNAHQAARAVRACPDRRALAAECARPALDLLARDGLLAQAARQKEA
ncbi:MAG: diiron oxygenase [Rhodospirillaceae bacterium]